MKPNPVVWFEIYVQDMPRAQAFYEQVFQCKLAPLCAPSSNTQGMQMLAFPGDMGTMGASGTLCRMDGVPSGGSGTLVYFACDDCAIEQGRVEAAGGSIFRPKFSIGEHGFAALVQDTEGNMIGLHSMQ